MNRRRAGTGHQRILRIRSVRFPLSSPAPAIAKTALTIPCMQNEVEVFHTTETHVKNKKCALFFFALIVLFFLSAVIINFKGSVRFWTGDVYADAEYAMFAWQSKSVFPDGWSFGNQYYVIATPVIASVFYGLTGSIDLAMPLATTVMTVFLIISLDWAIRPFVSFLPRVAATALLFGCMTTPRVTESPEGQLLFILASYYSCYLITIFVVVGDYLRAVAALSDRFRCLPFILSVLLLFATGIQSVRQTAILIVPLCVVEFIRVVSILLKKHTLTKAGCAITFRVAAYTLANFLGLITIRLMNIPHTSIYGSMLFRTSDWAVAHRVNMRILEKITGFYYAFHAEHGWLYGIAASITCGIVILSCIISARNMIRTDYDTQKKTMPFFVLQMFFVIGLIGLFMTNLIFSINFRSLYMFTFYALIVVSAVYLIERATPKLTNVITLLITIACLANWATGYALDVKESFADDRNTFSEIADYLMQRGTEYVYGIWWDAASVAKYTDGTVLAGACYPELFQILSYINPQNCYGPEENHHAVYLLSDGLLNDALAYAESAGADFEKIAEFGDGEYMLYTSDIPLMYH